MSIPSAYRLAKSSRVSTCATVLRDASWMMSTRPMCAEPFAVKSHFKMLRASQQNFADLGDVGFGIGIDLFAGQYFSSLISPGGISHAGGIVADDDDRFVAPFLKLSHDAQRDGMAKGDIGRGGIHAKFDAQRFASVGRLFQLGPQILFTKNSLAPARQQSNLVVNGNHLCIAKKRNVEIELNTQ